MIKEKCFHCGLIINDKDNYIIKINEENKKMCCTGCLAVAKFILDNGFHDYYRNRNTYGNKIDETFLKNNFDIYDEVKTLNKFSKKKKNLNTIILSIEGITCSACTWLIERYINKINGIESISINLVTSKANLTWNEKKINLSTLLNNFLKIGYKAYPYNLKQEEIKNKNEFKKELKKIIVSGLAMMQIMMLSASLYVGEIKDMHYLYWIFIRWSCFIISFPTMIYSGKDIFYSSYRSIKNKSLGMDFTICLSLIIAFIASINNLIKNEGEIYFDSICMFIFFLLLGRFLEMKARHHSSDIIYSLQNLNENTSIKIENNITTNILIEDIKIGDNLIIKQGCIIPVDGKIINGETNINESMLTGESNPVYKKVNNNVIGGTTNIENTIIIQATQTYTYSTINIIITMLEQLSSVRPKINIFVDKIANYFIFFVLCITTLVAIIWISLGENNIFNIILSMLVITCPCALSLATPIAMTNSTNSLIKIGFLITKDHTINTLNKITDVIFDKTGTLTHNYFTLKKLKINKKTNIKHVLSIVYNLEKKSNHPIAKAFIKFKYLIDNDKHYNIKNYIGLGIEGQIEKKIYRFGKYDFIKNWTKKKIKTDKNFPLILADKDDILAYFNLENPMRQNTKKLINIIKQMNLDTHILSGDPSEDVEKIANYLNITNINKNISVKGKVKYIDDLIIKQKIILMIGDGINDAPALNTAHVSIAMGSGADLTKINSDAILLNNNLLNIYKAIKNSKKTTNIIKQNIIWAIIYNFIGLTIASLNIITPYYAAIGMSSSSLIVVLNSFRLRNIK
ncbi:MAG TPA: heavy metal translocating P-type ATPase [Candidatus Azoamicus sp. MARI]